MQDPVSKYPKPPFKRQSQPWPGLAGKMEKFGSMSSLGRPGQPAELASIYVQLASSDASYTTGAIYGAAGGTGQP